MMMVRRGNGHRVNVLANLLQHLAVIAVLLEVGELLGELPGLLVQRVGVELVPDRLEIRARRRQLVLVADRRREHLRAAELEHQVRLEVRALVVQRLVVRVAGHGVGREAQAGRAERKALKSVPSKVTRFVVLTIFCCSTASTDPKKPSIQRCIGGGGVTARCCATRSLRP